MRGEMGKLLGVREGDGPITYGLIEGTMSMSIIKRGIFFEFNRMIDLGSD